MEGSCCSPTDLITIGMMVIILSSVIIGLLVMRVGRTWKPVDVICDLPDSWLIRVPGDWRPVRVEKPKSKEEDS